jgi:hypothetical protein
LCWRTLWEPFCGHSSAVVGLHSNAGILLFGLICCTQIPEFEVVDGVLIPDEKMGCGIASDVD